MKRRILKWALGFINPGARIGALLFDRNTQVYHAVTLAVIDSPKIDHHQIEVVEVRPIKEDHQIESLKHAAVARNIRLAKIRHGGALEEVQLSIRDNSTNRSYAVSFLREELGGILDPKNFVVEIVQYGPDKSFDRMIDHDNLMREKKEREERLRKKH